MAIQETQPYTAAGYIQSLAPNANVSENTLAGVLLDARIDESTPAAFLTQKQKDLAQAYLVIRLATSPVTTQKVLDRDGDWEHSEGSEQWSLSQLRDMLRLAYRLLQKWGITDDRLEALIPKWGVKGTGFRNRRRYNGHYV